MPASPTSLVLHWFTPHHSNNHRAKLLHPSSFCWVIGVFVLAQLILSFTANKFPRVLGFSAAAIQPEEIIRLTNLERASQNLPPVKYDEQLSRAAAQKAADMFARNYWAHISPVGTQPWHFITQNNYSYRYAGENLARDFSGPESIIKAWLASPSHRENLLNNKYQDIGVAVVDGRLGSQDTTLVVQLFATRLSSFASPESALSPQLPARLPAASSTLATAVSLPVPAFAITKYFSIFLLGVFAAVLVIDLITVYRRQIARWTSHSLAHLAFMTVLLLSITLLSAGQIL